MKVPVTVFAWKRSKPVHKKRVFKKWSDLFPNNCTMALDANKIPIEISSDSSVVSFKKGPASPKSVSGSNNVNNSRF